MSSHSAVASELTPPGSSSPAPLAVMNEPRTKNAHVRLLACHYLGGPDGESYFRFLVDGKHIKYVTVPPEALPENPEDPEYNPWDDMTTERFVLDEFLPCIPAGNWNSGHVAKEPETTKVQFVKFDTIALESVRNIWHPTRLDEQVFPELHYSSHNHETLNGDIQLCTSPNIDDGKRVIVKRVIWPEPSCMRGMENETEIYRSLYGSDVGPKFLGHLVEGEEGRVIGFVTEYVENTRFARGPEDLPACQKALAKLHKLGIRIKHPTHEDSLVPTGEGAEDRDAVLIDFEHAEQNCSKAELDESMEALRQTLQKEDRYLAHRMPEYPFTVCFTIDEKFLL